MTFILCSHAGQLLVYSHTLRLERCMNLLPKHLSSRVPFENFLIAFYSLLKCRMSMKTSQSLSANSASPHTSHVSSFLHMCFVSSSPHYPYIQITHNAHGLISFLCFSAFLLFLELMSCFLLLSKNLTRVHSFRP